MKLNPPASSSDIETARLIARRLHHSRRQEDRLVASALVEEVPQPRPKLTPPPLPARPAAPEPPEPAPRRAEAPEPPRARTEPKPPPRPAPPPPPEPDPEPDEVEVDAGPAFGGADPEPEPFEDLPSPPGPQLHAADQPSYAPEPEMPEMPDVDVDVDAAAVSPEEMVGAAPDLDASPLEGLTDPEASPFDEELLDAPPVAEEAVGPSWDDILESCRNIAQARGAMLVDPAGQVFAARGDWPPPGPDAIASKLVAMMAKTLKDAPTRSISAPLMGMHLTAWRVPLSEGLVTAAFIGPAAVRADSRPAIDAEIAAGVRA
jgi:hypothetical protein